MISTNQKDPRLPVTFPGETYEWLREEAFKQRRKMAELVRQAVDEYRHRVEPQLDLPLADRRGE